jgi:adenosylcobinamide-phosphate synthase
VAHEWVAALAPRVSVLGLAFALDALFGEPRDAWHPVAWIGRVANVFVRRALGSGPRRELAAGAALALLLPLGCALIGAAIVIGLARAPWLALCVQALLLKASFALRALIGAGVRVARELQAGRVDAAREGLRSLCSRDPAQLDAPLVAAAAVESLAENASDSVVAPLFYYACFGLPGALFYRAVNTLDAMIGYHGRYEYLGKTAARLDDALNLVPARLTAGLLLIAGLLHGRDAAHGVRVMLNDGARTESPNAGRPMAAMAGLLRVTLEKPGQYRLGDCGASADAVSIHAASRIVALGACLDVALLALAIGVGGAGWG